MIGRWVAILLLALLPAAAQAGIDAPEAAFVQGEALALPDGRPGEMRQVRSFAILSGPDALLVLDDKGRLLAKSGKADALTIVCGGLPRTCHGFDHDRREMLLLDPAGFETDGPVVPPLTETDRRAIGPFAPSGQSWGFSARAATLSEHLRAEWTHATRHAAVHATALIAGALLILLLFVRIGLPKTRTWSRLALWALGIALRLVAAGYLLIVLAAYLTLGGFSAVSLLACVGLGVAMVLVLLAVVRMRRKVVVAV